MMKLQRNDSSKAPRAPSAFGQHSTLVRLAGQAARTVSRGKRPIREVAEYLAENDKAAERLAFVPAGAPNGYL
jgi:hypothetical protein